MRPTLKFSNPTPTSSPLPTYLSGLPPQSARPPADEIMAFSARFRLLLKHDPAAARDVMAILDVALTEYGV